MYYGKNTQINASWEIWSDPAAWKNYGCLESNYIAKKKTCLMMTPLV